ncbi:tetratricopeptide repeat protein [Reinekea blandensis]|uniref:TPR repeat protein n=1 Tax=Reinekea blandensis MED297 TaxID=314283 RepID=A4BI74_9GAMM|nr:tetratricopeptide repeat protein [Reinekea blandensis]EAR08217.1 TPR repeat protein [Reinekea sp. MED297] [Reinekea blandensis MED297]
MPFFLKSFSLTSLCSIALLSSCAQVPADTTAKQEQTTPTQPDQPAVPAETVRKASLTGADLFQLLLAEIATNRREYGAAAALYGELSDTHDDVAIIERAVALNQTIGNYEDLQRHAEKFLRLRPDDERAHAAVTLATTAQGDAPATNTALTNWLSLAPEADVSILLSALEQLDASQLEEFAGMLANVSEQHPDSGSLYYVRSRLVAALDRPEDALQLTDQSLSAGPSIQAGLFRYQLLESENRIDEAGQVISDLYRRHPDNRQIAIQLTRHLYQHDQNLSRLKTLYSRFPTEPVIARTYALTAFQQESYDTAQAVFQRLQKQGFEPEANYYLGRIDLQNALPDLAVSHFSLVTEPPYLTSAMAEWVNMARPEDETALIQALNTAREAHPDQAETLWRLEASYYQVIEQQESAWSSLNEALIQFPTSEALLYDQAMLAAQLNRYPTLEANLQTILESDPDNINALNALGYTWADLNKNLTRAEQMIDQALSAEPDNPAFQDSKGWLLYRQGNPEEALNWLEKAFEQMENDEVAAHLAEVLWTLGREEEALERLNDVIRLNPESQYIGELNELFTR